MIKYLSLTNSLNYLTCPYCYYTNGTTLKIKGESLVCNICRRKYKQTKKIIEFVQLKNLDKETRRELKGNTFALTKGNIKHYENKDQWSNYYNHSVEKKMQLLVNFLSQIKTSGLISLGSGPGFEIKQILKRKKIKTVFSSDLAFSATSVVPYTLKKFNINLFLFTSDLNLPPIRTDSKFPIVIYEALHHTGDMVATIEKIVKKNYKHILLVEPCTNFLVKILARMGLAERVEYSGLKPEFLDLKKFAKAVNQYDYKVRIKTMWEVPEDYFRVICKKEGLLQTFLVALIDLISAVGNLFKFGNFAIISLERKNDKK